MSSTFSYCRQLRLFFIFVFWHLLIKKQGPYYHYVSHQGFEDFEIFFVACYYLRMHDSHFIIEIFDLHTIIANWKKILKFHIWCHMKRKKCCVGF
jgi:hypothetical protein